MDFETYLKSKRIDADAFRAAEPGLWEEWKQDFDAMHPNSFTVQRLNLINPVRRKYLLLTPPENKPAQAAAPPPRLGKPVIKPGGNPAAST